MPALLQTHAKMVCENRPGVDEKIMPLHKWERMIDKTVHRCSECGMEISENSAVTLRKYILCGEHEVSEAASEIRQSDHFASVVAGVQSDTDPVIEAAMEVVTLFASMRGAWFVSGSRLTFLADALTNCRRAKELEKGE